MKKGVDKRVGLVYSRIHRLEDGQLIEIVDKGKKRMHG